MIAHLGAFHFALMTSFRVLIVVIWTGGDKLHTYFDEHSTFVWIRIVGSQLCYYTSSDSSAVCTFSSQPMFVDVSVIADSAAFLLLF